MSIARGIGAGIFALGAGALAWATLIERKLFTVRYESLGMQPALAQPLRILHISDTHFAPWQRQKAEWLRSLATLRPDAVVLTGDLLGHKDSLGILIESLQPLAALDVPMFFVYGSNDYFGPVVKNPLRYLLPSEQHDADDAHPALDTDALTAALENLGAIDLNNSAHTHTFGDTKVLFFGMNDPHIKYDRPAEMKAAVAALDASDVTLRIGVVHSPYQKSLDLLLHTGADAILAGHTHGGQLRVPGYGALTSNSDLPNAQARGLSLWSNGSKHAYLNVSAGVGNSIFAPARFACPPEVSLLTLQ